MTCRQCSQHFEVTASDLAFYDRGSPVVGGRKFAIPAPTLCPACRAQRRMAWRNERSLFKRTCDLCQKGILSMYKSDAPFPVYCPPCWWGDGWSPMDYGQEFDFLRPFFEQFDELAWKVPHLSLAVLHTLMENSEYCNHAGFLKNSYLLYNSDYSEQCLYGKGVNRCFDCVDCFKVYDCSACYECLNCNNCTFSTYLLDSHTCDQCHFSSNLSGCKNCFGCVNLRNQQYCFFNEQLSPEEYSKKVAEWKEGKTPEQMLELFLEFRSKHPQKWMQEKNTEHCTGGYLVECKDSEECYDAEYLENCKYCNDLKKGDKVSYDNYDISYFGMGIEASYECSVGGYNANHTLFCENVWECSDVFYSQFCMHSSHHLFGCFGLKHQEYAIFNKKYSKEEYESLVGKMIEHMKGTGEWGEFFPVSSTPFGYNETTAQEYYPLTKEEVIARGWKWFDVPELSYPEATRKIPAAKLPDSIEAVPDDILNWAVESEASGRLFKIQKMELDFYRRMKIPVPHLHPDERHFKRLELRNARKLWERNCSKCGAGMKSTFSADRSEAVYCEKCYLKEVY